MMNKPVCEHCGQSYFLASPNYGRGAEWAHECSRLGRRLRQHDPHGPTKESSYIDAGRPDLAERFADPPIPFDAREAVRLAPSVAVDLLISGTKYNRDRLAKFQRVTGLIPDGLYGHATRNALACVLRAAAAPSARTNARPDPGWLPPLCNSINVPYRWASRFEPAEPKGDTDDGSKA